MNFVGRVHTALKLGILALLLTTLLLTPFAALHAADFSAPRDDTARASCGNGAKSFGITWIHFELEAPVGKDTDGLWTLRYTPAGGKTVTVEKLPPQKGGLTELRWVGFISTGTAPTKAWLDNIIIDSE
jgi:hypothetical protein